MTQRIAIRTDASLRIGTGHVMRCLTLAGALREKGAEVRFITRALDGHLIDRIEREGFAADILPAPDGTPLPEGGPAHAAWAEVPVARDAAETAALLDRWPPDWLILDHYAFDREWESVAKPATTKLMVIDDLADRPHIADLLLDQNLGRQASDYADLVPETCTLLIGPRYALLRPEFAEMRDAALKARAARDPRHILVAMGGVDLPNMTSRVLDALSAATLPKGTTVTVVMGRNAPALAAVQSRVEALPYPARLRIDAPDMAQLMAEADLAIGGVGVTTWERCALGLPTLMIPIAENQWPAARAMEREGAALLVKDTVDLPSQILAALAPTQLSAMSGRAAALCDGAGTARVALYLTESFLTLRPASMKDAESIYRWRYEDGASVHYRASRMPALSDHLSWFAQALTSQCHLLVATIGGKDVGHLRLDPSTDCEATVGIALSPTERGRGIGRLAIAALSSFAIKKGFSVLHAEVHAENTASLHVFTRNGYRAVGRDGAFIALRCDLLPQSIGTEETAHGAT